VLRLLRGVTLAACSAALTVTAHATAGGSVPWASSPGLTLVLTVLLAGAGVALAGRRRGFPTILAAVSGSQLAMHVLLTGLGHGHDATGVTDAAAPAAPAAPASVAMVVLHIVAAVLTAVLLAGAENAVFTIVGVLHWILSAAAVVVRPLPSHATLGSWAPGPTASGGSLMDVVLRRVHGRRGPPCLR
jgi:hypothetical protein